MIRINLLPREYEKKAVTQRIEVLAVLAGVGVVGLVALVFVMRSMELGRLNERIKVVDRELASLQQVVNEIDRIEQEKSKLTTKLQIIETLIKGRLIYPMMMEDMASVVPASVWLHSIACSESGSAVALRVSASALDNYGVADFIANLEESAVFSSVELQSLSSAASAEFARDIRKFSVNVTYSPRSN